MNPLSEGTLNLQPTLPQVPSAPQSTTQSAPQTSPPTQSGDPVSSIQNAIGQYESQGDYSAIGKKTASGDQAYGKYQVMGANIPSWTQAATGTSMTPEQFLLNPQAQDKTAAYQMGNLYKQYGNAQDVASAWFSGKPMAQAGNASDVNGTTTPQYVQAVMKLMGQSPSSDAEEMTVQQFAAKIKAKYPAYANIDDNTLTQKILAKYPQYSSSVIFNQTGDNANDNSSAASPTPSQNDTESLLGKLMDFAFPIVSDVGNDISGKSTKTPLQQLGDAGLSALWFAPGVGELGEGAIDAVRGASLLGEGGAKVAGQALGGAALGYGGDVASNLSQGKTGGAALTPGLGTATGGLLGGALGEVASKYSEGNVVNDIGNSNNKILGQWKGTAQDLEESLAKGTDQGKIAAQNGLNLSSMYNPDTLGFETQAGAKTLRSTASAANDALTSALAKVPGATSVTDLENELLAKVPKNQPEQADIIKKEMGLLRQQYGEDISAADVNEWKQRSWDLSKFDTAVPSQTRKTYRMIGNTLKTTVENAAKSGGLEGVADVNKFIGSHLGTADALDAIHGNKVKGGRLGDLLTKHTVGLAGAGIGGIFGGGPVGSLLGLIAGEYAGGKAADFRRFLASSPIKTAILSKIQTEDPQIVQKMLAYAKQTPQGLEAIQEQLAQKGINIFKAPKEGEAGILAPRNKPQGKLSSGLLKGAIRTATAVQ